MENTGRPNIVVVGAESLPTFTAVLLFTNSPEPSPSSSPANYPENKRRPPAEKMNKNINNYDRPRSKSVPYKRENFNYGKGRKNN